MFTFRADRPAPARNAVQFDPILPPQLSGGVTLKGVHWQGRTFEIQIGATSTTVSSRAGGFTVEDPDHGLHTISAGGAADAPP